MDVNVRLDRRRKIGGNPVVMEAMESRTLLTAYVADVVTPLTSVTGGAPIGPLSVDAQGNLYGTTTDGGTNGGGTVFEVPAGSPTAVALASFFGTTNEYPFEPDGGRAPRGSLGMDAEGNIYAATSRGGEWLGGRIGGTLIRIDGTTHQLTTLVSISPGVPDTQPAPYYPEGGVVADAAGNLYGTSSRVTSDYHGQIFKWDAAQAKIVTLALFDETTGFQPEGPLVRDAAGNLFGITTAGGAHGQGTIFELPAGSGTIEVLHAFDQSGTVVRHSDSVAIDAGGNLYGSMAADDSASVFKLSPDGTFAVLATRTGSFIKGDPGTGVAVDGAGNVFLAGAFDAVRDGVYEVPAGSGAFVKLAEFGQDVGQRALAAPVLDSHGFLFGTTSKGGANGRGAVYRVAPSDAPALPAQPSALETPQATASSLRFERNVTSVTAGGTLGTVKIDLRDANGKPAMKNGAKVMLQLRSRNGTGKLLGTVTVKAKDGVAIFKGLSVRAAGAYVLDATAPGFDGATSNAFDVVPANVATMSLRLPSADGSAGEIVYPTVKLFDRFGNLATNAGSKVTLSIASGPRGGHLSGTTVLPVRDGSALFDDVTLSKPGKYRLVVRWGRLTARPAVLNVH